LLKGTISRPATTFLPALDLTLWRDRSRRHKAALRPQTLQTHRSTHHQSCLPFPRTPSTRNLDAYHPGQPPLTKTPSALHPAGFEQHADKRKWLAAVHARSTQHTARLHSYFFDLLTPKHSGATTVASGGLRPRTAAPCYKLYTTELNQ